MISNMGMEFKSGLMVADMRAIMIWVKKVEGENMFGRMAVTMMETGWIIE